MHLAFAFGLLFLTVAAINVVIFALILYITVYNEPTCAGVSVKCNLNIFMSLITGKAKERQDAIQENKQRQAQAASDADSIDQSIADAQEMLEEVNSKLETVAEMKREADQMKSKVEAAYEENKDLIDTILYYASEGLKSMQGLE